jgi:hypothetical protein
LRRSRFRRGLTGLQFVQESAGLIRQPGLPISGEKIFKRHTKNFCKIGSQSIINSDDRKTHQLF